MDLAEFDRFADEYRILHGANVAITGEAPEYFAEYKVQAFRDIADRSGVAARHILDFGSGIGNSVGPFGRNFAGADLTCVDVSRVSLDLSERRNPGLAAHRLIEGDRLPVADRTVDLAFSACVFHHIPHDRHHVWLRELHRVTRPGGLLSVFEHNPLNPLTLRAVNTCVFDANAHLMRARQLVRSFQAAGWAQPRVRFHLFFPRALAGLRPVERWLAWLPLGAQYSVTAVRGA